MAYPTGSGSEILGRTGGTYGTASTTTILTVTALQFSKKSDNIDDGDICL